MFRHKSEEKCFIFDCFRMFRRNFGQKKTYTAQVFFCLNQIFKKKMRCARFILILIREFFFLSYVLYEDVNLGTISLLLAFIIIQRKKFQKTFCFHKGKIIFPLLSATALT